MASSQHSMSGTHIHHFIVEQPTSITCLLMEELGYPKENVCGLLELGAIYLNKKRIRYDAVLMPTDYLRVHSSPKRYETEGRNWPERILFQNTDFVVVNKPSNIPVPSTVNNEIENLCFQLSQHLSQPLYVTHRLDIPVQGLVLLAKTKEFQTVFNKLLIGRKILKNYRAVVPTLLKPGKQIHYMKKSERAPKIISNTPEPDHLECILEIFESKEIYFGTDRYCLVELRLETGRTHQIRAQLAALGAPILGDALYGSILPNFPLLPPESIALQAYHLAFLNFSFTLPCEWRDILPAAPSFPPLD